MIDPETYEGAAILARLVPDPSNGLGFRRDPLTGFVYFSNHWLDPDGARAMLPAVVIPFPRLMEASDR
jgi:hypothetical protein